MLVKKHLLKIKKEAFRLELLSYYNVKEEQKSFNKFLQGIQAPPDKELLQFCDFISNFSKQGKKTIRVHVIPDKLTNYLRYEIATGYIPQLKAGSEIYLIHYNEYRNILKNDFNPNDFWCFDNKVIIELIYDKKGNFLNENLVKKKDLINKYIKLKNNLIEKAISLKKWLKINKDLKIYYTKK